MPSGGTLNGYVLDNDTFIGTASVALGGTVHHGTLALSPTGTFTYTPESDFAGTDSFGYEYTVNGVPAGSAQTVPRWMPLLQCSP